MTHDDELKKAAKEYGKRVGDDCLNQRTSPGTPVGECIYNFCGCHVNDAFLAGAQYGRAEVLALLWSEFETTDKVAAYWYANRLENLLKGEK